MLDWLEDEEIKDAHLLWVVDKGAAIEDIYRGLINKLPLIVPEYNTRLKDLCVDSKGGLTYETASDVVAIIEYLNRNEDIRRAMGDNALRLFYSNGEFYRVGYPSDIIHDSGIASPGGRSIRERIKGTISAIPLGGAIFIWLWRLLHLPTWFYRLNRHFESVARQVDIMATIMQERHDSAIQQLSQSVNSLSAQLDEVTRLMDTLRISLQRIDLIQHLQERHDSAIQQLSQSVNSINAQLSRDTDTSDTYLVDNPPYVAGRVNDMENEDRFYLNFENIFRGSESNIEKRQKLYTPYVMDAFNSAKDGRYFLDMGCGRGEFLKILKEKGIPYKGIEINRTEYEHLKRCGFDVEFIDANTLLEGIDDNSLIGISCFHVVEHLQPDYMKRFLKYAHHKIARNGVIVIETVNPKCPISFGSFYLDLTHIRPYPPELLKFLLEWYGFKEIKTIFSSPCFEDFRVKNIRESNYMDYAVVGWKR